MEPFPLSLKYGFVVAAAAVATLLCFMLMQVLIATELADNPVPDRVEISTALSLEEPESKLEEPKRKRPERILPAELPPMLEGTPILPENFSVMVKSERPSFESTADAFMDESTLEIAPASTDLMPLYIVQPVYPFSAVMKEIEGYVIVNFGVRPNGTVQNPVVVDSSPGTLFDEAALSAIDKFRFQPRTHLGDPLAVDDLQMRFVFKLGMAGAQTQISRSSTPAEP